MLSGSKLICCVYGYFIKDVIYKVKSTFNKEFEAVYKQKEQEIHRIREKNKRITQVMAELELSETLWEPSLTDNECPERALTVTDSEVKQAVFKLSSLYWSNSLDVLPALPNKFEHRPILWL